MRLARSVVASSSVLQLVVAALLLIVAFASTAFLQGVLVNIAASFLFIPLAATVAFAGGVRRSRAIRRFFGHDLISRELRLAYPDFVLSRATRDRLAAHHTEPLFERPRIPSGTRPSKQIDIDRIVAGNDVAAMLHLVETFKAEPGTTSTFVRDRDVVKTQDQSFVSFGLSSSECTFLYLRSADDPLFRIRTERPGLDYLELRDGSLYTKRDDVVFGIILRHRPHGSPPGVRWFLVAGLGPDGTPGAAWFLARHWRELQRAVRDDEDFVALIRVSRDDGARSACLEKILTTSGARPSPLCSPLRTSPPIDLSSRPLVRSVPDLGARAAALADDGARGRVLIGVTGPPGAGKSTLAARLAAELAARPGFDADAVVVVPMDGFHRPNAELDREGTRERKGAPETFDAEGFVSAVRTIHDAPEEDLALPDFDRVRDEPTPSAIKVTPRARVVIVEGNYLLLDEAPWSSLRSLLDEVWYVHDDGPVVRERLVARQMRAGKSADAAVGWVERSDEPNATAVRRSSRHATLVVDLADPD